MALGLGELGRALPGEPLGPGGLSLAFAEGEDTPVRSCLGELPRREGLRDGLRDEILGERPVLADLALCELAPEPLRLRLLSRDLSERRERTELPRELREPCDRFEPRDPGRLLGRLSRSLRRPRSDFFPPCRCGAEAAGAAVSNCLRALTLAEHILS